MFESVIDFLYHPVVAFLILIGFFTIDLLSIDLAGGFSNGFLQFGPGTTPETTANFIGIKMDTWQKVGILYVIGFLSAFMSRYYGFAIGQNLGSYAYQHAQKVIPFDKYWTYFLLCSQPVVWQIFSVLQLFAALTLQLQFIVPELLGHLCAYIPGIMQRLADKEFK
jgi:hypothetical protein